MKRLYCVLKGVQYWGRMLNCLSIHWVFRSSVDWSGNSLKKGVSVCYIVGMCVCASSISVGISFGKGAAYHLDIFGYPQVKRVLDSEIINLIFDNKIKFKIYFIII